MYRYLSVDHRFMSVFKVHVRNITFNSDLVCWFGVVSCLSTSSELFKDCIKVKCFALGWHHL